MNILNRQKYYGISGVYRIYNNKDSRCYIGSSNNLYKRINGHKNALLKNKIENVKLQRFVNKYGFDSIDVEVICTCDEKDRLELETYYIYVYNSVKKGFNCLEIGGAPTGFKWSDEQKKNKSISAKKNSIIYRDILLKNLDKARKALKLLPKKENNFKGKKHKEESKIKMRKSAYNRGLNYYKPIIQYDKNMNFIKEFQSAREAERETNVAYQNISKCCNYERKTAGKFIWRFKL